MKLRTKPLLGLLLLSISGQAREVSLYNGEEKNFRGQEVYRVLNVLRNMGVPYRYSSDQLIMVPEQSLDDVKEIVAQGFKHQRRMPVKTLPEE